MSWRDEDGGEPAHVEREREEAEAMERIEAHQRPPEPRDNPEEEEQ